MKNVEMQDNMGNAEIALMHERLKAIVQSCIFSMTLPEERYRERVQCLNEHQDDCGSSDKNAFLITTHANSK
jgi:hypothetical protein